MIRRGPRCAGCGKALSAANAVKDVDPQDGKLKEFHQRCAPSYIRNTMEIK